MVTRDEIRAKGAPELYPTHVLEGCQTALVLFAAAWHGQQDAIWIADAGLQATCVDTDAKRLMEMIEAYPHDWEYVPDDVFEFTRETSRVWDVVSLDCPTNLFERCAELLELWCVLANRYVILGCAVDTPMRVPRGWRLHDLQQRSNFRGGVYWAVLERE